MADPDILGSGDDEVPPVRLEGLTAEQLRMLAYASAIGREFDFRLLVAAMGADEESLAEQIERLVHRGILRERVGGDRFGFVEEDTRARVYKSLTASRLRVLHRKIAEAMERLFPNPPPEIIPELGRHYFLGKEPKKSYEYNLRAAELARADDNPEVASHHLERARIDVKALPGNHGRDEARLAEQLGDLYYSMGDVASADRLYTEALAHAGRADPRLKARLVLARAEVARENLQNESALQNAREARELFRAEGDQLGMAQSHRILGRVAFNRGAYRESLDECLVALELLRGVDDPRTLGRLSIDIGNAFAVLGPEVQEEAVEWYQRAIDRLTQAGDWGELSRAYHNLGVAVGESRPSDGLEYLQRAREFGEKAHEPRHAVWPLVTGVEMRLNLGQVEDAQRDNEQAGRILERLDDQLGVQQVIRNRGLICEKRGQWEDAEKAYHSAIEMAERYELAPEVAEGHFLLARLKFKTRDLATAREEFGLATHLELPKLKPSLLVSLVELGRQLSKASTESQDSSASA